jgi:hypothetical protein
LPEYRIEDHFENFIANNLDYTKYTNSNYLSLRGMDSDIEDLALSKQIDNVVSVKDKKKKIKFKFNIIKKLLPYNGFYPQNRSVKIVEQFQKSFFEINDDIVQGDNVISYSSEDSLNKIGNNTPLDQQIQTILQPFFAPGLLFNSIKAGMSVTFPVFIGNVSSEASSRFPYYDAASESFLNNIYSTGSFLGNRKYNFPYTLSGSNNTFIFTDLLDPFYKLYQYKTLYRNGISQNLQNEGNTLLYIAPDAYGLSIPSNKIAYPSFHRKKLYSDIFNQGKNINLYKLLINNFISEIPNFFIENKKLTSFFSKDETQFKTFTAGVAYYMDLVLERDEDIKSSLEVGFSVPNETFGLSAFTMTEGAAYGYPFSVSNNRTLTISSDYGYAPVSPPYINGKTTLRFKFVPSETRSYSLEEIQNSCELENINDDLYFSILTSSFTPENSPCYTERMLLEKCINPFGKTIRNNISYDQFGNVVQVAETSTPNKIWTIHTLFESPILNFNTSQNYNHAYSSVLENEFFAFNYLGAPTYESWSIRTIQSVGMWTGYGEIPKNNGVSLSIQESFNKNLTTGSLLDQCGFNIETKNIGVVANKKQISEGILVLPYLNYNSDTVTDKTDIIESKRKTIKISKSAIDAALKTNFDTIADVKQLKKILNSTNVDKNNSIIKTMKAMLEYNIPAHLDWIVDRTLEPIAMYIAEVKHDLDQQDLVDIWQGLLPKIGTTAELDEVTIEHDLADDQILNNLDDIDSLKFKVFKVKKKANINYYDLTDDSSDDTRFKFIFNNERKTPNYSYNWPYDHFSLAELVNIEAGYTYITGSI